MTEDEGKRYDRVYRRRRLTIAAGERKGSPTLIPLACGPSARSLECSLAKMLPHSRAPLLRGAPLYPPPPPFPSRMIAQRTRAHFYPQHWLRAIWVCISSSSSFCLYANVELELELIKTKMTQKPMLRVKVVFMQTWCSRLLRHILFLMSYYFSNVNVKSSQELLPGYIERARRWPQGPVRCPRSRLVVHDVVDCPLEVSAWLMGLRGCRGSSVVGFCGTL